MTDYARYLADQELEDDGYDILDHESCLPGDGCVCQKKEGDDE